MNVLKSVTKSILSTVAMLGLVAQGHASQSLPEKIKFDFQSEDYKLKCVEDGIPYWIKFDGKNYRHYEEADSAWAVGYSREKNSTFDDIPEHLKSQVSWTASERLQYHSSLLQTAFAKVYKNRNVSFKTPNKVNPVGIREGVVGANRIKIIEENVSFVPKKVSLESDRFYALGEIKGVLNTVSQLTREGEKVFPELAGKKYYVSMDMNLSAKLHLNTGIFTSMEGSIVITPKGSQEIRKLVSFSCNIDGPKKIPVSLSQNRELLIELGAISTESRDLLFFHQLMPGQRAIKEKPNAIALVVGVEDYELTASAKYAEADVKKFQSYAVQNLGIKPRNVITIFGRDATERGVLLAIRKKLLRSIRSDQSDVYVFFAGHGLASDNGEKMYLLPYDGSPELLDDTAILRDRLFSDIASANPRSVTVFLDTCYSGTTRGTDMLIASRPIAIKALEQSIPDNFTVMTAAAGDQTAKPLEEAKHGMFSYFLMKGMEGEADTNQDNKITAGELHQYVQQNVVQQSSGSQTPELQGDAERVLVRFQER